MGTGSQNSGDPLPGQTVALYGKELRARFSLDGDRNRHIIEMLVGDRWRILVRSREGTASEHWPPSPPFQNAIIEELTPGRWAALLVGMAGASHWSMSVESEYAGNSLTFDVACRPGEASRWLGSTYELGGDVELMPLEDNASAAYLTLGGRRAVVGGNGSAGFAPSIVAPGRQIALTPAVTPAKTRTIRWRYRIALEQEVA